MNKNRMGMMAAALSAAAILPGCIIVAGGSKHYHSTRTVETTEMAALMETNKKARLGMPRGDVLALYPADLLTMKSVFNKSDAPVEVWQVYAVNKNGRTSFTRWLYFYDDKLVLLSDERVSLEDRPELLESWQSSDGD